jgi:signal transduction histidine kinase
VSALLAKTLRSSTFKLALLFIGIFGVAVIALFGYVYWSTTSYLFGQSDNALATELAALKKSYDGAGRNGLISAIQQRIADPPLDGSVFLLADPSFQPVVGNLAIWPEGAVGSRGSTNVNENGGPWPLRVKYDTLSDGSHLLVGRAVDGLQQFAHEIDAAFAVGTILVFVLAAVASVSVTRRTVGRIESINATSRAIMQSGLDQRIPIRGTQDEWDELAANLNMMLDRIEALMGEVKQVTDNVAHDLRTPLARMHARLEKGYHRQRTGDYDPSLIGDIMTDLEGVLHMFSSLIRISQVEAYGRTAAFRLVSLSDVAHDVVELFDATAEDKGVRLTATGDKRAVILGDRDLLFDAVANLVDNAIKYGCEADQVAVEVNHNETNAVISVTDHGPGIPASERQHVFKRFYRLEGSRGAPGNGLGLSLVAAVARLHGARVEMIDNLPGLKIQLLFPSPVLSSHS